MVQDPVEDLWCESTGPAGEPRAKGTMNTLEQHLHAFRGNTPVRSGGMDPGKFETGLALPGAVGDHWMPFQRDVAKEIETAGVQSPFRYGDETAEQVVVVLLLQCDAHIAVGRLMNQFVVIFVGTEAVIVERGAEYAQRGV